ncbi:MAG TPA: hypothetical protein VML96_02630 [Egibacteraceae bacterium]|nr:hypothetical protein [Egibacteraceae bacterium]
MIDVYCRGCATVVLLWPSNIDGLSPSPHGTVVHYHCLRGHRGAELVVGAPGAEAAA